MAKLDKVVETVLQESVVEDAAELVGIEKEDAADRISGLSFANYLELGNAVEMEDAETAREILGTVSPIEEDWKKAAAIGTMAVGLGAAAVDQGSYATAADDPSWDDPHDVQMSTQRSVDQDDNLIDRSLSVKGPNADGEYLVTYLDGDTIKRFVTKNPPTDGEPKQLSEVAPPGMEGWIKKRKPEFKERYGDRWEEVLYATAWKQHNNESVEEGVVDEEKLLDKPTPTLKDLAKKHDMSLGDIGAQLAMGIKAEKEHTSDMLVAKEIALDHLNELPDYYTKLEKMEEAKPASNAKNYMRSGGNKEQFDWKVTLNNGKTKKVSADSRKRVKDSLSTNELIIGIKSAKKINEAADPSNNLYHVTHTKYVPNIQKNGIRPMGAPSNWVQQGSGDRYGMGEIYVFTSKEDAKKWAGRMDWDFNQTIGSGEISIITLNHPADQDFEKDEADPMSQAGQQGEWLKTYEPISPENIVDVQAFKSMNEADNPYATPKASAPPAAVPPSTAASSIDALAQPNATSQEVDNEENQRKEVDDLSIGDDIEVIDISGDPTPVTVKNPRGPGETLIVQTDKGEEHMIKKMAVSGTPKLQELAENFEKEMTGATAFDEFISEGLSEEDIQALEEATINEDYYDSEGEGASLARDLGTYGWIIYISWSRDDLDYALYKNIDKDNNRGDYRFLKVDKATGSWQTQRGKRNDEMATESGDAAELMHVIKAIEASETVEEGQNANKTEHSGAKKGKGAYYGQKKTAKRDSNKKRRANDKQAVNEDDLQFFVDPMGQGANVMSSNGDIHDYYDDPEEAQQVAAELNDKQPVNEAESFFFFVDPDERGGATVMSSKGDIHDYYEDIEVAMQEVRRLNAEFGKDNEGNPIGVNESVLSDHVTVEYKDPAGRFIVVTAGAAGHWAVGKGQPYEKGIEQWSHNNLEDAINQADADANDLDNLREMKRMAGIKETSSGGCTGAGAIASAPAAVGGSKPIKREISGTQSIYGKTNKKPKPKTRAKESTEDGIGRNKK